MQVHKKISFSYLIFLMILSPLLSVSQKKDFASYTVKLPNVEMGIDMVAIPGGKFTMGSRDTEKGRNADEGPQIQVKIDPFWMGKYEIPWDIYELYIFQSGDVTKKEGDAKGAVDGVTRPSPPYLDMTFGMGKNGHPAVGMTQYNAIQFCKWLYLRTGEFYCLPTEAQWEYACRAGSQDTYSFGNAADQLGDYAWYADNSNGKTHPIGTKKANAWGLHDMYGNAQEWTIDQYAPDFYKKFKSKAAVNPVSNAVKLYPHSVRGGSYESNAADLRSASRQQSDPLWKKMDPQIPKSNWWFPDAPFIGVRIVRPLNPPSKEEIEKYYNIKPIADY